MRALIDGDVLAYAYGSLVKRPGMQNKDGSAFCPEVAEGEPLPFAVCWGGVQSLIEDIKVKTAANKVTVFLTSNTKPSARFEWATIKPYKGNRDPSKPKPHHYQNIRDNFQIHYDCVMAEGWEADDAMAAQQWASLASRSSDNPLEDTVICTPDKDLNMVPGWHYSWGVSGGKEKPLWFQDVLGGLKCFYKQLCTGDATDNILGLYGVGPKSAVLKVIDEAPDEHTMASAVYKEYYRRFGNYAVQFMVETGRLLWMQRWPGDLWTIPEGVVKGVEDAEESGPESTS